MIETTYSASPVPTMTLESIERTLDDMAERLFGTVEARELLGMTFYESQYIPEGYRVMVGGKKLAIFSPDGKVTLLKPPFPKHWPWEPTP